MLVLGVQQSESIIHVHIPALQHSFPGWIIIEYWVEFPVLCSGSLLVTYLSFWINCYWRILFGDGWSQETGYRPSATRQDLACCSPILSASANPRDRLGVCTQLHLFDLSFSSVSRNLSSTETHQMCPRRLHNGDLSSLGFKRHRRQLGL